MIFLLILFFVPFLIYKWLYTSSKNQPPSPKKLPILGNLHQLGLLPHRSLQLLSNQHGPLMLLHLGNVPVLIASSANTAREIMKSHDSIFATRPKASIADRVLYGSKDIAFAPYGEYWRHVRGIAVQHLLSDKMVQSFRSVREEETSDMIDRIAKLSTRGTVNLTDESVLISFDIVCRVILGRKYEYGENGRKFMLKLREFTNILGSFNVGDYIPWLGWVNYINGLNAKVKKVAKEFDEFLEGVVEDHKNQSSDCFLDTLLQVQRENVLDFPLQNESIKALLWDMFSAGTESTHTVLEWALSELIRNPKTMKKLQNEVRLIAQGKLEICENDLAKMHFLKAVIKETLRLHPPAPLLVPREATQNIKLIGYEIKESTQVFINVWAIGRDPLLWEMPENFKPERFLNNTIDFKGFLNNTIDFKGLDFQFIPFGAGRRGCPGISFGILVNELALAKLVHKFNFLLPSPLKNEDLNMTEVQGITIRRKFPLIVTATLYNE